MAQNGKSVLRGSAGVYYARQNMLTQVGSVTTNGIQQKSDFRSSGGGDMPVWPNLLRPTAAPPGTFPLFTGIRVFDRDYRNPRIYSFNVGYEREIATSMAAYLTSRSRRRAPHALPEYNVHGTARRCAGDARRRPTSSNPFEPLLSDVFVTNSRGLVYQRRHLACVNVCRSAISLEANYVLSKIKTTTRRARSFTDRSFNFYDLSLDYGPADRDITTSSTSSPTSNCRVSSSPISACRRERRSHHPVAARAERRR